MIKTYCFCFPNNLLSVAWHLPEDRDPPEDYITDLEPPEETSTHAAKWTGEEWELVSRSIDPTINKTTVIADGEDAVELTDLPDHCTVIVDDESFVCTDGSFEITFDTTAEYLLKVLSDNMIDYSITITAE